MRSGNTFPLPLSFMTQTLDTVLQRFSPVSLSQMEEARLMNRIDTKFVANVEVLPRLLELMNSDYFALEINNLRSMPYYSCYFDTETASMYYEHQRGKKTRQKIRLRRYESSHDLTFLEVKDKNNKGRTKKVRCEFAAESILDDYSEFIASNSTYSAADLAPQITNHFYRITLVKKDFTERVTIDTHLEFHNLVSSLNVEMPDITIIEWKRKKASEPSPLKSFLKELRIKESGFSKYCIGMAMTNKKISTNRIKNRLRWIRKLSS